MTWPFRWGRAQRFARGLAPLPYTAAAALAVFVSMFVPSDRTRLSAQTDAPRSVAASHDHASACASGRQCSEPHGEGTPDAMPPTAREFRLEPAAGPQSEGATAPASASDAGRASRSALDEIPLDSGALTELAAELQSRLARVEREERELDTRKVALEAVEERIDEKIERLRALRDEVMGLAEAIRAEDDEELVQLVKVYEAMNSKRAARVFDQLQLDVTMELVKRMRESKVAAILGAMDPARAKTVTAELARERELPQP